MNYLAINQSLREQRNLQEKTIPREKRSPSVYADLLEDAKKCGISPIVVKEFMDKTEARFSFAAMNEKVKSMFGGITAALLLTKIVQVIADPLPAVNDALKRAADAVGGTSFNIASVGNDSALGASITIALGISGLLTAGSIVFPEQFDSLLPAGTDKSLRSHLEKGDLFLLPDPNAGGGYEVVIGGGVSQDGTPDYIAMKRVNATNGNCSVVTRAVGPGAFIPFVSITEAAAIGKRIVSANSEHTKSMSDYVVALLMARADLAQEITFSLSSANDLFLAPPESSDITPKELNMYFMALATIHSLFPLYFAESKGNIRIVGNQYATDEVGSVKSIVDFWRDSGLIKQHIEVVDTSNVVLKYIAQKWNYAYNNTEFFLVKTENNEQYLQALQVRSPQSVCEHQIELCYDVADDQTLEILMGKITVSGLKVITGVFLSLDKANEAKQILREYYAGINVGKAETEELVEKQVVCVTDVV